MSLPKGKLTVADVVEIKERIWHGEKQRSIAEAFGVSQTTISNILRGYQWGEVRWPNGDVGHMPEDQWRKMKRQPGPKPRDTKDNELVQEVARRVRERVALSGAGEGSDEGVE